MEMEVLAVEKQVVIFFETRKGFVAVETDGMDMGILSQQSGKIIALFVVDIGIKAAFPIAGGNGIPKSNMMAQQHV